MLRPTAVTLVSAAATAMAALFACTGDDPVPVGGVTSSSSSGGASSGTTLGTSGNASSSSSSSGSTDCVPPQLSCGGKCTAADDPANCGACGHSCGAGTGCTNGTCTPFEAVSGINGSVFALAASPKGIVIGADKAYSICTVEAGCTAQNLTTLANGFEAPSGLAVSADTAFFHDRTGGDISHIYKCKLDGCGQDPTQIDSAAQGFGAVTVGPNLAVWTRAGYSASYFDGCALPDCGSIQPVRKQVGTAEWSSIVDHELAHPTRILSAGAASVFWATGGLYNGSQSLRYCKIIAGGCDTFVDVNTDLASVVALAYHDGRHYFAAAKDGVTRFFSISDATPETTPKKIVSDGDGVTDLAVDATGLYWVNATTGDVRHCGSLDSCDNSQKLATGQQGLQFVDVDAKYVYWSVTSKVMKVAK